jgi:uncharacterized integral membrane protein
MLMKLFPFVNTASEYMALVSIVIIIIIIMIIIVINWKIVENLDVKSAIPDLFY